MKLRDMVVGRDDTANGQATVGHLGPREILERLVRPAHTRGRVLIRGGTVLTMDPTVPDLERGDVLLDGARISAVEGDLGHLAAAPDVTVVDATGMVVIPGLQDTHRHCWQSQLRRLIPGADLDGYIASVHSAIGPHYDPDDIYAGTLVAALGAVDAGMTTVMDYSHNSRTAAHSDAAVRAFTDAGVRVVHASGPPLVGEWDHQWPRDLARLRDDYASGSDGLVSLRMGVYATADLGGVELALTPDTIATARGLGIGIIADAVYGPESSATVEALGRAGLLGPDVTLIHCTGLSDGAWRQIADSGTQVSLCPTSDSQVGCMSAVPPVQQAIDHGVRPGLSVDVECCVSGSMFAVMQAAYTIQRMGAFGRRFAGEADAPKPVGVRDVLLMATAWGARVNGLADRVGTLTPGKDADLVLIDAQAWNTMPLNHAVGTVVLGAETRNVDAVFVAGEIRKWNGDMVGHSLPAVRELATASRDRVLAHSGLDLGVLR